MSGWPQPVRYAGLALFVLFAIQWVPAPARAADPVPVAVFDFELYDTSLEGEVKGVNAEEQTRLQLISEQLRDMLGASERYRIVDIAPASKMIADAGNWQNCRGCDTKIAKTLGAELSMTGEVQKVSNLILNINIYVRNVETGKLLQAASADIRGNTDKSWKRGVSYLVRNRLLRK